MSQTPQRRRSFQAQLTTVNKMAFIVRCAIVPSYSVMDTVCRGTSGQLSVRLNYWVL